MLISRIIFYLYCKLVFFFYTPLRVLGKEKIPEHSGIIFASNHNSHSDTAIIAASSRFGFTRLAMLAASDYWFDNIVRRFFFQLLLNLIPIDRGYSKNKVTLERTLSFCKKFTSKPHHGIVMYPEGTRSRNGKLQNLKDGVSLFSVRLKVPIVPVYIKGSFETWSKGKFFIRPGKLVAEFLDPIYPTKIDDEYQQLIGKKSSPGLKTSKIKKVTAILYQRLSHAEKKYQQP